MSLFEAYNLIGVLHRKGLISTIPSDLNDDNESRGPIKILASRGLVNEREAINTIVEELNVRYLDLSDPEFLNKSKIASLAENVSPTFCWMNKVLPLYEDEGCIVAACINPLDYHAKRFLELNFEKAIELVIVEEDKLVSLIDHYIPRTKSDSDSERDKGKATIELSSSVTEEQHVDAIQTDAPPVVRLVNKIIAEAIRFRASDIHLDAELNGLSVRFRVDGILHHIFKVPAKHQPLVVSRLKILSGMDIAEKRRPQDGRMSASCARQKIDIRVSCLPTAYGEKMVLRLLPANGDDTKLSALGFGSDVEQHLKDVLFQRGKMLLVTGPTGSGKTTTLYACLNFVKDGTASIQTIEDPIELKIPGVSQSQVNLAADVTFASALRSILRQDPDIIMVGEIRDAETADIAIQAAQTGHLVLSTLHTNNAPSAITRLVNLDCKPYIVASSLAGVLAQRLVRRICLHCRKELDPRHLDEYINVLNYFSIQNGPFFVGRGCQHCNGTGYKGRTAILSYLGVTDRVADLIACSAPLSEILSVATEEGYISLEDSAIDLAIRGETTFDEIKGYLLSAYGSATRGRGLRDDISVSKTSTGTRAQPYSIQGNTTSFEGEPVNNNNATIVYKNDKIYNS